MTPEERRKLVETPFSINRVKTAYFAAGTGRFHKNGEDFGVVGIYLYSDNVTEKLKNDSSR